MEIKKSDKANLENKKLLFFEIGMIIALLVVYAAFEYTTKEKTVSDLEDTTEILIEEEIVNVEDATPPPPPPTVEIPILSDQIDIVDNDIEVEDIMINTEDDENLGVEIQDYVADAGTNEVEEEEVPFMSVEVQPSFMGGGTAEFNKWVGKNLVYPEIAMENGISGRVMVQFTVEKDGTVTKVKVLRGVEGGKELDEEAVRVIKSSPKWTPGQQQGRSVRVQFVFPVVFRLQ